MAGQSIAAERASSGWKVTYSSFLTGLLAFFLLLVFKAEKEAESTYKFADRMKEDIYQKINTEKQSKKLNWLYVEHAGPRGIKILIPSEIGNQSFFQSGDDQIASDFLYYLNNVADIVESLELQEIPIRYKGVYERLEAAGSTIKINVRIEGHSDAVPLGRSSKFNDNWALSTARAHQVMQFFMSKTQIPSSFFSVSGYGPFHPLVSMNNYDENRRVEIYLDIQMVDMENGFHG